MSPRQRRRLLKDSLRRHLGICELQAERTSALLIAPSRCSQVGHIAGNQDRLQACDYTSGI